MATLEEQFAALVAGVADQHLVKAPDLLPQGTGAGHRTRTVYSVGEAISQRGPNAKLGAGIFRDTGARR